MKPPIAATSPKDRFAVYRFFNGLSAEGKAGLNLGRPRVPLVKTFLLEHVARRDGHQPKPPDEIFRRLGAQVDKIDDTFMSVSVTETDLEDGKVKPRTTGYLEKYNERFFAYYTAEEAAFAKKRVASWIQSPDLDATWFSSFLLQVLWNKDVSKRGDDRSGKLVFKHESIFEMPEDSTTATHVTDDDEDTQADEVADEEPGDEAEERVEPERRRARFEMGDRIGRITAALENLKRDYYPLHALYSVRLPSRTGRGSHDLFQAGQVTNRTDSFLDHRNTVRYLYRIYNAVLNLTEDVAWHAMSNAQSPHGPRVGSKGVPLIVKFGEPLSPSTFDRWVSMAFRKGNRFKLWGDPIRLGPTKVHVYGADRHLWQPINLELTEKGVVAILPQGTCGNTFHRLVTNVQQYVCPKIDAWLGDKPFQSVVSAWPANVEDRNEN
ncbi:MAG: hypothetical protein ABSE73_08800 [Planctomycetota bacterium]